MDRLEKTIQVLTDDFSFDENGIMKITRVAVNAIVELLKDQKNLIDGLIEEQLKKDEEQQAEIERLKSLVKKKNKRIKNLLKSNYLNGESLHV